MQELFDKLLDSFTEYRATKEYYNALSSDFRDNGKEQIAKLKYEFQDALNDYIDKRIELANNYNNRP